MKSDVLSPKLLARIVGSLAPDRILLFGSRQRSQPSAGSDVDLLLVGRWAMAPEYLVRHARRLVMNSFPRIDLAFCHPDDLVQARRGGSPFLASILNTAVVIYDASSEMTPF